MEVVNSVELVKSFNANQDYIEKVNKNLSHLQNAAATLWAILEAPFNEGNYDKAFDVCRYIVSLIPVCGADVNTKWVLRARYHDHKEPLLSEKWQLSYNERFKQYIQAGRFNKAKEPLFYAALPREDDGHFHDLKIATLTCAGECYKDLSKHSDPDESVEFTFSRWYFKKPIHVAVLCIGYSQLDVSPHMTKVIESFFMMLYNTFDYETAKFIENFYKKISKLSRTSTYGASVYQVLSAFFTALRDLYSAQNPDAYQGVIFPSSQTAGEGLNIVLTPRAVDDSLDLKEVWMYHFCIDSNDNELHGVECSDYALVQNDVFTFQNYKPKKKD